MPSINEAVPVVVPVLAENVARYLRGEMAWWVVAQAWSLAVPAVILWTGFSARIQGWVTKPGRSWFFIVAGYSGVYAFLTFVADWSLSYYVDFARPRMYGISHQTISAWIGASFQTLIASVIVAYFSYWFIYWLMCKSPRRWWLYLALSSLPVLWFQNVYGPRSIAVEPGRYERLSDPSTEEAVLALSDRANVHARVVVDVKATDGNAWNAFAIGTSDAKPIVLGRTLVAKLDRPELLATAGHEVGHYARHHALWTLVASWLFATLGWYAAHRLMPHVLARHGTRFGFERVTDIASLPLLMLVLGLMSAVTTPLELALSRHQEREADRIALDLTHANHSFATGLIKAHEDDRHPVDPRPGWFFQILRADHPSLAERIELSNTYK